DARSWSARVRSWPDGGLRPGHQGRSRSPCHIRGRLAGPGVRAHSPARGDRRRRYVLSSGAEEAIDTAQDAAGTKDVGVFGADVAAQCISSGLVDEIFVHLVPVLLGDGIPLFNVTGTPPVKLRKTRCDSAGQITDLTFEVPH